MSDMYLTASELVNSEATINARIDGVDERIDGVDERIDGVDVRADNTNIRIDNLDARITGVDERINHIVGGNAEIAIVQEKLNTHIANRVDTETGQHGLRVFNNKQQYWNGIDWIDVPGSGGGGESYLLPQATETTLGGIKAKTRTTESNEVVIDTTSGKLYTASSGGSGGESAAEVQTNLDNHIESKITSIDGEHGLRIFQEATQYWTGTEWANIPQSELQPETYDLIIRTQEEFDSLIASPNWSAANKIFFEGSFIIPSVGITVPDSVSLISGGNFVCSFTSGTMVTGHQLLEIRNSSFRVGNTTVVPNTIGLKNCRLVNEVTLTSFGQFFVDCYQVQNSEIISLWIKDNEFNSIMAEANIFKNSTIRLYGKTLGTIKMATAEDLQVDIYQYVSSTSATPNTLRLLTILSDSSPFTGSAARINLSYSLELDQFSPGNASEYNISAIYSNIRQLQECNLYLRTSTSVRNFIGIEDSQIATGLTNVWPQVLDCTVSIGGVVLEEMVAFKTKDCKGCVATFGDSSGPLIKGFSWIQRIKDCQVTFSSPEIGNSSEDIFVGIDFKYGYGVDSDVIFENCQVSANYLQEITLQGTFIGFQGTNHPYISNCLFKLNFSKESVGLIVGYKEVAGSNLKSWANFDGTIEIQNSLNFKGFWQCENISSARVNLEVINDYYSGEAIAYQDCLNLSGTSGHYSHSQGFAETYRNCTASQY